MRGASDFSRGGSEKFGGGERGLKKCIITAKKTTTLICFEMANMH